jgi:hypothetical protein
LVSFFSALALVVSLLGLDAHAVEQGASKKKAARETCAFTGTPAARKVARRPAVAVRISNSPDARPQSGVESADLVIETLTEGGTTRLISFFHCSPARTAGPVRSARMDDAAVVSPYSKLFAFSGANAPVMEELEKSALTLVTEANSGGVHRVPVNSTDVNSVNADVTALRSLARSAGATKPSTGFRFGQLQKPKTSVSTIDLDFGGTTVGYRWGKGGWARSQDGAAFRDASGRQVKTTNVLVQEIDASPSKSLFDSNGVASPRFDLVGSGRAWLFRDGKMVQGTWTDSGAGAPVFKTSKGAVMNLARGRTWLEMVPSADGELSGMISYR